MRTGLLLPRRIGKRDDLVCRQEVRMMRTMMTMRMDLMMVMSNWFNGSGKFSTRDIGTRYRSLYLTD